MELSAADIRCDGLGTESSRIVGQWAKVNGEELLPAFGKGGDEALTDLAAGTGDQDHWQLRN
jgi:hypothetical protein